MTVVVLCLVAATLPWACRPAAVRAPRGGPPGTGPADVAPAPADVVAVLDLLDAAVAAGTSVPRALVATGRAIGGGDGAALERGGASLLLGAPWSEAWRDVGSRPATVADCLGPTWASGAAPGPALREAADHVRRSRRHAAREAAGRLGVRLVLPLGLCFLPAFVLVGVLPLVLAMAGAVLG